MRRSFWAGASLLAAAAALIGASSRPVASKTPIAPVAPVGVTTEPNVDDGLIVHEWGTFLSMGGSDGATLDGMYHEEHALPEFVHARSRDQLRLPTSRLKGETPVIYFYTNKAQKVRVEVKFPQGVWTQWYPQAGVVRPALSQAETPLEPKDGSIYWCAEVIPTDQFFRNPRQSFVPFDGLSIPINPEHSMTEPPAVGEDVLWRHAREVDAAIVRTPDYTRPDTPGEVERFLFYRGLGQTPLPLTFSAADGGTLQSRAGDRFGARHIFVLRIEKGRGAFTYRTEIKPGEKLTGLIPSLEECSEPVDRLANVLANAMAEKLENSGLYTKEARAMVNTWKTSYFRSEGVRALVIMPQEWTDEFIPISVTPKPRVMTRVMVGWLELLLPERERLAEEAVRRLGSKDESERRTAFAFLREQGRYVEPVVRRVLASTNDPALRDRCRQLLATDFLTELRSSIHAEADGRRIIDDPVFIRAQLAMVLKSIGLEDEARAEGQLALNELAIRPMPNPRHSDYVKVLRAYAQASEAAGDAHAAAEWSAMVEQHRTAGE